MLLLSANKILKSMFKDGIMDRTGLHNVTKITEKSPVNFSKI